MKSLVLAIACVVAIPAFATSVVYNGNIQYTISYDWQSNLLTKPSFNDLEQLGVERGAEKQALQACAQAGASDCVITSASISSCNYDIPRTDIDAAAQIGCSGVATVRGQMN